MRLKRDPCSDHIMSCTFHVESHDASTKENNELVNARTFGTNGVRYDIVTSIARLFGLQVLCNRATKQLPSNDDAPTPPASLPTIC